jgi:hypothetical protein
MSKTSSKNAMVQSNKQHRTGLIPYWVDVYDAIVVWDPVKKIAVCRECKKEIKNRSWLMTHMRECFGIIE